MPQSGNKRYDNLPLREVHRVTGRENVAGKAGTEVTSEHVSALKAREFSILVGKLLSTEAQESDIPLDGNPAVGGLNSAQPFAKRLPTQVAGNEI